MEREYGFGSTGNFEHRLLGRIGNRSLPCIGASWDLLLPEGNDLLHPLVRHRGPGTVDANSGAIYAT
jgi:hypothetical protein